MKSTRLIFPIVALLLAAAQTAAQDLTDVDEIVRRANEAAFYAGSDGRTVARMVIVDSQGRQQQRQFTIIRRNVEMGGDQSFLVLFSRPADVRNTVFLVQKHVNREDDRWLYLPDLDLVKRIASGDKRTSFVGSHFFYEDVSGRGIDEDTHELVETTDTAYVVRNVPIDPASAEFAEYTIWIDKGHFLPTRIEYLNDAGKLYRTMETVDVQIIDGYPTAVRSQVRDLETGGYTLMEMRNAEYDLGIPDEVFTERSLRNPPAEWFGD